MGRLDAFVQQETPSGILGSARDENLIQIVSAEKRYEELNLFNQPPWRNCRGMVEQ